MSKDDLKRSREDFVADVFEAVFGLAPQMKVRKDVLPSPAIVSLVVAVAILLLLGFAGAIVGWLGADEVAPILPVFGLLLASPFMGTAFVLAYRWFMNDRDYAAWERAGRPADWTPRASSQPGDRDFLLGLPWVAMFAWFAVGLWLNL